MFSVGNFTSEMSILLEAARDGPLDFNLVKCSLCGLSHSEHRVSKVWKGRSVCKECSHKELTRERPPDYAGDINHIGFKKGTECGCWSCSGSDLNSNIYHKCGQCMKYSNNGWVDRKTGDDTWFCRDCWLLYFKAIQTSSHIHNETNDGWIRTQLL